MPTLKRCSVAIPKVNDNNPLFLYYLRRAVVPYIGAPFMFSAVQQHAYSGRNAVPPQRMLKMQNLQIYVAAVGRA